ncbi:uncharacterized protein PHALS_01113 [Plasmopara halstedii]|uniref:Uncharacterized protein n=1 Tax=Plasmopara halstedii TaxID=4781 RepID=A0A0P1ATW3_PLAHL|nr:uncharacterized protein PHALS_01113 [Plasmopara halstedii]CEG44775.1 hypothetical protein PHALS_01113 [Plasmopara halstedii]|eukprot:XP_024581144.1 hypothetical protein PHALS_01113 [Plasmopara halstedii]
MEVPSVVNRPRWTGKDSICVGLSIFVAVNVLMCLWVAAVSMSTARRQATAVFMAVENASSISFNLHLNTHSTFKERINVTGRIYPRYSKCFQRLYFDGRMVVTSMNTSEMYALTNHRGYRWPIGVSSVNATCLRTQELLPLHTLADTVHSAIWSRNYSNFCVLGKPLLFTFNKTPYTMCAEDWLRARLQMTLVTNGSFVLKAPNPVLMIYGDQSTLELTVLSESETPVDTKSSFQQLDTCEYLEAPMTSGEICSFWPMRCPNPHQDSCTNQTIITSKA